MNNLIQIIDQLQSEGKDAKVTVLPSTVRYNRTMKLRGNRTAA